MKRSAAQIRRLIRAQETVADLARLEHRAVAAAAADKGAEIEALERWSERLDAQALPLLDVTIERQRTLAAQKVDLGRRQEAARERLVGATARCRPLERAHARARQDEARAAEQKQLAELIDRQIAGANQGSRKPRRS
ncbi:MAG: hypothetical protein RIB53_10640 [Roseitalea porphyridii]|jgi:hypothetical protein|uniref:hypothetical protein n=1 Tax=Roseitalea porphyridii TaxID=1852022 RepID=UPI0032ECE22D